jgi:hypothetical protein
MRVLGRGGHRRGLAAEDQLVVIAIGAVAGGIGGIRVGVCVEIRVGILVLQAVSGSCVADRLLDVRTTVPACAIRRPRTCSAPLSLLAVVNLLASAPPSQKPQLVDGTLVSSACSFGERFSAFMASASSGGVWPVTE